jgi:hypothetical protein
MSNNNNNNTPQDGQGGGSPNQESPFPKLHGFHGPPMYGSPPYQMYGMLPHHMTNHMMPVPPAFAPPAPAMQTMYSRGEVSHSFDCPVDREVLKNAIRGSTANGIYQETTVFGRSLVIPTTDNQGKKIGVIYTATSTGFLGTTDDGIVVDGKMYEFMGFMSEDQKELLDKKPPPTTEIPPENTKRPANNKTGSPTLKYQKLAKKKKKMTLQSYRHQKMPYDPLTSSERARMAYNGINRLKFHANQAAYKEVMEMIKTKRTEDLIGVEIFLEFE